MSNSEVLIRTDAYDKLMGQMKSTEEQVKNIMIRFDLLSLTSMEPLYLTITDICKLLRLSRTELLTRKAYYLPDFGAKSDKKNRRRYETKKFFQWLQVPEEQRIEAYKAYLEENRLKYVG